MAVSAQDRIALKNETPTGTLHGSLMRPAGAAKPDIVLIQPGSGASDRNGNFPGGHNNSLLLLSRGLAGRGIATLRIDKRAIGESRAAGLDENRLRFETYVEDYKSWANLISRRSDSGRLFLAGHSQGALVATLAAQELKISGLILLAPAALPAGRLIARQTDASGTAPAVKKNVRDILAMLEAGKVYPNPPANLRALFRPSIQRYLISWFRYDPATELRKLRVRTLIVQGTTDLQVRAEDTRRLTAAGRNAVQVNIAGMNHMFKTAPADRRQNFATYNMPELPLAPGLVARIAEFIRH